MEPTLPVGSLVAVAPVRGVPRVGSVVVVRRPDGTEHVKRVIAGPGDRYRDAAGVTTVLGSGLVALAGDNRDRSTDSRHYGPVALSDVVGVDRFCYWPPRAWKRLPSDRA